MRVGSAYHISHVAYLLGISTAALCAFLDNSGMVTKSAAYGPRATSFTHPTIRRTPRADLLEDGVFHVVPRSGQLKVTPAGVGFLGEALRDAGVANRLFPKVAQAIG